MDFFSDDDFRELFRAFSNENRNVTRKNIFEYGDEFGDFDAGSASDFRKAFIDPFADVVKVALGSVAEISSKARAALSVFMKGIPGLVIPFVTARYEKIFAEEEARMQKIQQKYGDIFAKTDDVFKGDAGLVAFMLNPYEMLVKKAIDAPPASVIDIVQAITGQDPDVVDKTEKLRKTLGSDKRQESVMSLKDMIFEASPADRQEIMKVLKDVEDKIKSSQVTKDIQAQARNAIEDTLGAFERDAEQVASAKTIEDLEKLSGEKIDVSSLAEVPDEEQEEVNIAASKAVKNAYYDALTYGLELAIEEFEDADIPEGAELSMRYKNVVNKINGLKRQ